MKYDTLITPYVTDMDKAMPWDEYPRPQLKRNSFLCLNGAWDFAVNKSEDAPLEYDKSITVPFPPESLLSGLEMSIACGELMHYRKKFRIPDGFNKGRIILHFGAVDQICKIYVNKKQICEHIGGYLPFSVDITDSIRNGENELCVCVRDDLDLRLPYGKQTRRRGGMWYTPVSGIWQTVWIESVPKCFITSIKITPDCNGALIEISGGTKEKRITLKDSSEIIEFSGNKIRITPKEVRLWTPENPCLYYFTLEAGDDRIESYFALREIDIKNADGKARICLNGKPYIFNGLLDQGYYPDGIFLPAAPRGYEEDILLAKRLGFNMLRKHIKLEPAVFYYLCDKLGMAVFQDMINNSDYSFIRDTALPTVGLKRKCDKFAHKNAFSRAMFEDCMRGVMDELYSYPSVLYYTVFNEGWGQFEADKIYLLAKELDPTRIIDATSGWFTRKMSDVDSRHVYFKKIKLGRLKGKPLIISEFGGYSHRVSGHLFGDANYGYRQFGTEEHLERAFVSLYENEVLPLIKDGACGFVYTQISDVEDETNGLVTYDRKKIKVNEEKIRKLMNKISGYLT